MFDIVHLGDDLAGSQVADKPALGREAEAAPLGTPHLAGNAKGVVIFFRDQYAFDQVAVTQAEQVFLGTVPGGFLFFYFQALECKMFGQALPGFLGQVGHFFKAFSLVKIDPFEDLGGPEGSHAVLGEPISQLFDGEVLDFLFRRYFRLLWLKGHKGLKSLSGERKKVSI